MDTLVDCLICKRKDQTITHDRPSHHLAPEVCNECKAKMSPEEFDKYITNRKACTNKFCMNYDPKVINNCTMVDNFPEEDWDKCDKRILFEIKPYSKTLPVLCSKTMFLTPVPKLKPAVAGLLELINSVYRGEKDKVKFDEAFEIYKQYVGRGEHAYYNRAGDRRVEVWGEWTWERNFKAWLFKSLGTLIEKGCITVIPTIELSKTYEKIPDNVKVIS